MGLADHFIQSACCGVCGKDSTVVDFTNNYTPCDEHMTMNFVEFTHFQYNSPKSHWNRMMKKKSLDFVKLDGEK